ncbi:Ig-like domain-containing protein, partial [Diaphorobacter ruginosibacter]|uniref:Ig-like domain-containing protein n=1 Tax=Diaphorobacter ruginosibacter TaxID=1715720 RepID=UPI00333E4627
MTVTYPDGSTDSVTVGEDGKFEFENPGLEDGDTVNVVATDPSGNSSDPTEVTVDAVNPDAPIVDPINSHDPITGEGEPGSTVTVTYPDGSTDSVTVGEDGKFEFENPGLDDGDTVNVVATDPSGNSSDPTEVTVDAVSPDAPIVDPINAHDPITGEGEPGSTVTITYPDGETDSVVVGEDGKFEFENPGLEDGDTVNVVATDPSGNSSDPTEVTVDAVNPDAPVVDPINANDPITGEAEPGSTVTITYPDGETDSVVVGEDGKFEFENPGLEDGDTVNVVATDPSGNSSDPTEVTVDAVNPDAPIVDPINAHDPITGEGEPGSTVTVTYPDGSTDSVVVGEDGKFEFENPGLEDGDTVNVVATDPSGNSSDPTEVTVDAVSPDAPIVDPINAHDPITGEGEPGSTVTVTYPDGSTDSVVVGEDGKFEFENPGLEDGDTVNVVATDPSGNSSDPTEVTVDAVNPDAPIVDPINAHDPITGEAEPGSTVTVTYPDGSTDSVVVGEDGKFEFENPGLSDGDTVNVVATDPSGNSSDPTDVTVDAVAPVLTISDNVPGVVGIDGSVTFTFTFSEDVKDFDASKIQVTNGTAGTFTKVNDHTYELVVTPTLNSSGTVEVSVAQGAALDASGNPCNAAQADQAFITSAPNPTDITSQMLWDDQGAVQGEIKSGDQTDDSKPTFSGTADASKVVAVQVFDNGTLLGTVQVQGDGTWSFEPALPLPAGPHNFTAKPVDAAGNVGSAAEGIDFSLLGAAPAAPAITGVEDNVGSIVGNIQPGTTTDDTTPTFSGTAGAGTTINIYDGDTLVGTTTALPNGTWSITVDELGEGSHSLIATATDGAGQTSDPTGAYEIIVDTIAPAKPSAPKGMDDVGDVTGEIASGATTDDATPTLSGTGQAGETVTIYDGDTKIGTTTVGEDGTWSFTPATDLGEGSHSLTSTLTDAAGNTSAKSDPLVFTVDSSAVELRITQVLDNEGTVIGAIANGGATDDTTPTFEGKATANATVSIYEGSTLVISTVADASGNWSVTLPAQSEGAHSYTAQAQNAAGNTVTASFSLTV